MKQKRTVARLIPIQQQRPMKRRLILQPTPTTLCEEKTIYLWKKLYLHLNLRDGGQFLAKVAQHVAQRVNGKQNKCIKS
jgi:hypothetical protein